LNWQRKWPKTWPTRKHHSQLVPKVALRSDKLAIIFGNSGSWQGQPQNDDDDHDDDVVADDDNEKMWLVFVDLWAKSVARE